MDMGIQVFSRAGLLTLIGLVASACANSGPTTSTNRSGAQWARDLNEPPPPARALADRAQIAEELNTARTKASR
jgi:hypothetical protein